MATEWTIARLVPGGSGFLRLPDGRAAFVEGAFPGDVIEPIRVSERPGFVRADSWRLVRAGPGRVEPVCPVVDRCGGCDWMRLDVDEQRRHKILLLKDALRRTGQFVAEASPIEPSPPHAALAYRHRLRLHTDSSDRIGLYAKGTHDLVEIRECAVCRSEIIDGLAQLRSVGARHPRALREFDGVEIRTTPLAERVGVSFSRRSRRKLSPSARAMLRELARDVDVALLPAEEPVQRYPLGTVEMDAPPGVFTQIHWEANLVLVDAVVRGAVGRGVETFCDLYCGAGNFTLPLLQAGCHGVAIDRQRGAVRAGRRAAERQGLQGGKFFSGDVETELNGLIEERKTFDLVLLDPPRSGARGLLRKAASVAGRYLAYCSCDPVTLARDLKDLVALGLEVESVRLFDLFPQTHHFETLVWCRRRSDQERNGYQ